MKRLIFILTLITFCQGIYSQVIIDRSEQVPIKINNIFFMADYPIMNDENKKFSFSHLGLGKGQIFTYKGDYREGRDFQSLVLINAFIISFFSRIFNGITSSLNIKRSFLNSISQSIPRIFQSSPKSHSCLL